MADKKKPEESEPDENGTSVFDLFEPPPERDPNSFGKIPVIRDEEIDLTDSTAEIKAAADAEAAGLQHWTAPPTGQVPAVLAGEREGTGMWGDVKGPSWHGEDPSWDGPDLADVFADTQSVTFDADVIDLDDEDDDEGEYSDSFDSVAVQRPPRAAGGPRPDATTQASPPAHQADPRQAPARPQAPVARQSAPQPASRRPAAQAPMGGGVPADLHGDPDQTRTTPPVRADNAPAATVPEHRNGSAAARPVPPTRARSGEPNIDDIRFAGGDTDLPPGDRGAAAGRVALRDEASFTPPRARNSRRGGDRDEGRNQSWDQDRDYDDGDDYDDYEDYDDVAIGLAPAGGRNIPQAIGVGLALAGVVLAAMYFGPYTTMLVIVVLALLAVLELYNAMRMAGLRPATLLGIVGTVAAPAAAYYRGDAAFPLIVALAVIFGTLWYLVGADTERPVLNLSLTMMGIFWVGGLASFGALMVRQDLGIELLLATIIITVASDTMAYIGGRAYGSRPFHHASPNKTWEGTLTGFFGSVFAGFAIGITEIGSLWDGRLVPALVLGAVVGCLAPMGDLAESVVKRDLGVKDMGTLLPGHGGVLDRLDGLLFALPGAFYLALVYGLL
ncbi:MAG: phosphatidate cytidylyltransferase [Actinomycetota bacterium]